MNPSDTDPEPETDETPDPSRERDPTAGSQSGQRRRLPVSRRTVLGALGIGGLGVLSGESAAQGQPDGPGGGPPFYDWQEDVDANGNDLRNLGGLNTNEMADEGRIADFAGSNLAIDDDALNVADRIDVDGVETDELTGGVTGGEPVRDFAGENLSVEDNRLNAATNWRRRDGILELGTGDVEGISVERVESPDDESLSLESAGDLVLSVSGAEDAVRIETAGGHEIVLDDGEESESVSVEDSAGNSVELDPEAGEVSVSANSKISLDAPEIELSAGTQLSVESGANVNVQSQGVMDLQSAGVASLRGALVQIN